MSSAIICDECQKLILSGGYKFLYTDKHQCQECHTKGCWNCTNNPKHQHKCGEILFA